jgi:hypothetical protein
MPTVRPNGRTFTILASDCLAAFTQKWTGQSHHYIHEIPYSKMDGIISFLHTTAMPPIRQNGRTNQNLTTTMPPIIQNGCTYIILVGGDLATHTPKWADQSLPLCHPYAEMDRLTTFLLENTMPSIRQMDGTIVTSLSPCHPYAKTGGPIQFFHATTMQPIRQYGRINQDIITCMPPIRQIGWTYSILASDCQTTDTQKWTDQSELHYFHSTRTPKWTDLYHSCTPPPCHPNAKMEGPIATSMPPTCQIGWTYNILARDHLATYMPNEGNNRLSSLLHTH